MLIPVEKTKPLHFWREKPLELLHQDVDLLLSGDEDKDPAVGQRPVDLAHLPERFVHVLAFAQRSPPVEMRLKDRNPFWNGKNSKKIREIGIELNM
jgi:hypothetical protein